MTLRSRNELGSLITALGYQLGVELGVAAGAFSDVLLNTSSLRLLTSVDKWDDDRHPPGEQEKALALLAKHGKRSAVLRETFERASERFGDASVDFVYVDGYAHTGQGDGQTLLQWWAKLKPGGMMAGHDYHADYPRTVSAVNRFAALANVPLFLTSADKYPSWYVFKPGGQVKLAAGEALMPATEGPMVKEGESMVLVGNGPSLLGKGLGEQINACTHVVRFNQYKIRGYMVDVGHKTTHWACTGGNQLPVEGSPPPGFIHLHGDTSNPGYPAQEIRRVPLSFYRGIQERVRTLSAREDKVPLLPSSGLLVALWLLETQEVPVVKVAGFDHFSRATPLLAQHHYWRRGSRMSAPREHDGEAERALLQPYFDAGRLVRLEPFDKPTQPD